MRKFARLIIVAAVNLAGIAVVLGAGELFARYQEAQAAHNFSDTQLPMCRPDDLTIWRYRANVDISASSPEYNIRILTNDVGLRGGPIPPEQKGQETILFIGDSFTFGWGVSQEERYSSVVERLLRADNISARVINAGHWMYTFDQQLVLMKEMIRLYHPKVVVQGFYWMHVRTLYNHQQSRAANGQLIAVSDSKIKVTDDGALKFRSDWLEHPPLNSQLIAAFARGVLNRDLQVRASDWVDFLRVDGRTTEPLWQLTESLITETAAMLRDLGVSYVPFLIPVGVQVGSSSWDHLGWQGNRPPADIDLDLPNRKLSAIFARSGTDVLDPTALLKLRGGPSLYFPRDGHWNVNGHRVIAEMLAPALKSALSH